MNDADEKAVVEMLGVTKGYADAAVLRGLDLRIRRGEAVAVTGPSGCGKSTLLNLIGAMDRSDGGSVRVNGREVSGLDEAEAAELRRRELGFVFQHHHLLPQCTAMENVLVPVLGEKDTADDATIERAKRLLSRVGLADRLGHRPGQLSGGQRQRVAVVRALIYEPGLLLADEPTGSLDEASAEALTDLLLELNGEMGLTLLVVTHDGTVAARMGRRLNLAGGRLAEGTIGAWAEGAGA